MQGAESMRLSQPFEFIGGLVGLSTHWGSDESFFIQDLSDD